MSQAFYYLVITTTPQSAYSRSHNKLSRYFCFKVIYILFCHKIDLFLSVSCMIKWKVMLPLYNDEMLLLTVLDVNAAVPYNNHLSITTAETLFPQWSLYTGLTVQNY